MFSSSSPPIPLRCSLYTDFRKQCDPFADEYNDRGRYWVPRCIFTIKWSFLKMETMNIQTCIMLHGCPKSLARSAIMYEGKMEMVYVHTYIQNLVLLYFNLSHFWKNIFFLLEHSTHPLYNKHSNDIKTINLISIK